MIEEFPIHLKCPRCGRGEAMATAPAAVTISLLCPKCGKPYLAELGTCKTYPSLRIKQNKCG